MVETLYVQRDVDALVFYMLAIGIVSLASTPACGASSDG